MLVTVLFLGSRLTEAVEMMESSRKGSDRSYLVIHYHPSLLTVQYNLAKVRSTTYLPPTTYLYYVFVVFKMLFPLARIP